MCAFILRLRLRPTLPSRNFRRLFISSFIHATFHSDNDDVRSLVYHNAHTHTHRHAHIQLCGTSCASQHKRKAIQPNRPPNKCAYLCVHDCSAMRSAVSVSVSLESAVAPFQFVSALVCLLLISRLFQVLMNFALPVSSVSCLSAFQSGLCTNTWRALFTLQKHTLLSMCAIPSADSGSSAFLCA